jgi:hypothetical protein
VHLEVALAEAAAAVVEEDEGDAILAINALPGHFDFQRSAAGSNEEL